MIKLCVRHIRKKERKKEIEGETFPDFFASQQLNQDCTGVGGEMVPVWQHGVNCDDDCFYHHSWRNNVVIAFGTLSSFLT